MVKTQPPVSRGGMFSKDDFDIDLDTDTATCPNGTTVPIRRAVSDAADLADADLTDEEADDFLAALGT